MMIEYLEYENELLLFYTPDGPFEIFGEGDSAKNEVLLKHTYFLSKNEIRQPIELDYDYEETYCFCIGTIEEDYYHLDSEVFRTHHQFYFSKDIKLKHKMFLASRNIAILPKIDSVINHDFYVGGNWEEKDGIPIEEYKNLLDTFPKSAELNHYVYSRISNILSFYFPESEKYKDKFYRYIDKKDGKLLARKKEDVPAINQNIEYAQFAEIEKQLREKLDTYESYSEDRWQQEIQNLLQLLYPQYIYSSREIKFKGIDGYDKRPDFLLVDTNGFVDILEIKRPDVPVLTSKASYRKNYVPVKEFSGTVQQIEKYIYCLTFIEESQKQVISKLKKQLPQNINPEIVNPKGILLLGRSKDFNEQQKRVFELIKRQYKHITDIMTYDDLLQRIVNIKEALGRNLKKDGKSNLLNE